MPQTRKSLMLCPVCFLWFALCSFSVTAHQTPLAHARANLKGVVAFGFASSRNCFCYLVCQNFFVPTSQIWVPSIWRCFFGENFRSSSARRSGGTSVGRLAVQGLWMRFQCAVASLQIIKEKRRPVQGMGMMVADKGHFVVL